MTPLALPVELSQEKTERLRTREPAASPAGPPPVAPGGRRARVRHLAKRVAYATLGPARTARVGRLLHAGEALRQSEESIRRVGDLEQQVAALQRRSLDVELVQVEAHAASVNLELLKGEIRSVVRTIEELGMAIAPAAGLAGAGARLSELRERVNGLDRRLRSLAAAPPAPPAPAEAGAASPPAPQSALFDYVGFERRFRGDPEVIVAELARRYLDLLAPNPPVVDIGCGRAELVELLTRRGIEAVGVDTDPSMVAEARDRGLDVHLVDGNDFLRNARPGSIGAIVATHLVEHIGLAELVELLELAASRLKPGGVFVAETPNPTSLVVLGNSFILDPTHLRPLHPSLLTFLCENAGFRDVRLRFYAPASDYHLPPIDVADAPPWLEQVNQAFAKLNVVLFGPQEYAIVATTAPEDGSGA